MPTTINKQFYINGVVSPNKTVLQNLESLCASCGAWFTFDINTGKWSVVINKAETNPVYAFDDDNIIGSININGSGLNELYNKVQVQFPHVDLRDELDSVTIAIPQADLFPNEFENTLNLQYDLVNDPLQAQTLALMELKQSRVDKIITFQTSYKAIGIKAGDIISVKSQLFWSDFKPFRVINVSEEDTDDNNIILNITALEYDSNVYNINDINYYERTTENGLITIGAIGQPAPPQVSKFEVDSRPRFLIELIVPAGIIEGMELWYYQIPDSELPNWQLINDNNRTYNLFTVLKPTGVTTNTFGTGAEINTVINTFGPGNYLFKTRGINNTTSGPYSTSSGLVEYNPYQVTDAVGPNTQALDEFGNPMLGLLGANVLLALIKNLMENGLTGPGSIYRKIMELFSEETGADLEQQATELKDFNLSKIQISDSAGDYVANNVSASGTSVIMHSVTFTATQDALYKVDVLIDQNSSGARGGRGTDYSEPRDSVAVGVRLYDSDENEIFFGNSGGVGAFFWTDFAITKTANLIRGEEYRLDFSATVSTESNPSATASFDIGWNVYTLSLLSEPEEPPLEA